MGNSNSSRGRTFTADTELSNSNGTGNDTTIRMGHTTHSSIAGKQQPDEKQQWLLLSTTTSRLRRRFLSFSTKQQQQQHSPYVFGTLQLNSQSDILVHSGKNNRRRHEHNHPKHTPILPRHVQVSAKCLDGLAATDNNNNTNNATTLLKTRRQLHKLMATQGQACQQLTVVHSSSHPGISSSPRRVFRQDLQVLLQAVWMARSKRKARHSNNVLVEQLEFAHVHLQALPEEGEEGGSWLFQEQLRQLHQLQSLQFHESRLEAPVLKDILEVLGDRQAWPHLSQLGLDVSCDLEECRDAMEEALAKRLVMGHLTSLTLSFCPLRDSFWKALLLQQQHTTACSVTSLRLVVSNTAEFDKIQTLLQDSSSPLQELQISVRPTPSRSASVLAEENDTTVVPPITLLPLVQGLKENTTLQSLAITLLLPAPQQQQQQQQPRGPRKSNINSYRKISRRFHQDMVEHVVPMLQFHNFTVKKWNLHGCMEIPVAQKNDFDSLEWTRAVLFYTKLNRQGRASVWRQPQEQQQDSSSNTLWKKTVLEAAGTLEDSPMALSCLNYWLREQPERMEEWRPC